MSLAALRADLSAVLADALGVADAPLGGQVNPPLALVRPGDPYIIADGYCDDLVALEAAILAPPGDPPAVVDALDDLIDLVRAALIPITQAGNRFSFQSVSGHIEYAYGDRSYPAVTVSVQTSRKAPNA